MKDLLEPFNDLEARVIVRKCGPVRIPRYDSDVTAVMLGMDTECLHGERIRELVFFLRTPEGRPRPKIPLEHRGWTREVRIDGGSPKSREERRELLSQLYPRFSLGEGPEPTAYVRRSRIPQNFRILLELTKSLPSLLNFLSNLLVDLPDGDLGDDVLKAACPDVLPESGERPVRVLEVLLHKNFGVQEHELR